MRYSSDHKAETRERVLKEAANEIRAKGPDNVAVSGIMARAGLTHGGFYAHFASRDALLVEAMQHAGRESAAALDAAIERRMARGRTRFEALVESYLHDAHLERPEQGCVVAAFQPFSTVTRSPFARRKAAISSASAVACSLRRASGR